MKYYIYVKILLIASLFLELKPVKITNKYLCYRDFVTYNELDSLKSYLSVSMKKLFSN